MNNKIKSASEIPEEIRTRDYSMFHQMPANCWLEELKPRFFEWNSTDRIPDLGVETFEFNAALPHQLKLESFLQYLMATRAPKERHEGIFSPATFSRWHSYAVVHYIDLELWARREEVVILAWLIGEIILPGNNQGDKSSRVDKTIRPTARKIMSKQWMAGLAEQVVSGIELIDDKGRYSRPDVLKRIID